MTILAVPFNTMTSRTDSTLILSPGDHPFINRTTAVSFDLLMSIEVDKLSKLEEMRAAGIGILFERHAPATSTLLTRIIKGALQSDETPKGMVRALKERLGINSVEDL